MTKKSEKLDAFNTAYFEKLRAERTEPFGDRLIEVNHWLQNQDANWMMTMIRQRMLREDASLDGEGIVNEALRQRFEASDQAAILLSENLKLLLINKMAKTILGSQASLVLQQGHLKGATPDFDKKLRLMMNRMMRKGTADSAIHQVFTLNDQQGQTAAFADAVLVGAQNDAAAIILLTIKAPKHLPDIDLVRLRAWFGLSKKEAKLAASFACGTDLQDYAAETGVSISTVRTQFAHIKSKMDAPNIATVVRLTLLARADAPMH